MMQDVLKMIYIGQGLYIDVWVWSVVEKRHKPILLMFDTGASITTLSPDVLNLLGYTTPLSSKAKIVTASGVEISSRFLVNSVKLGSLEVEDVEVYSHNFPEESFSTGVVGLNVLRNFDIELLFSENLIKFRKTEG